MHTFFLGIGFGLVTSAILALAAVAVSLQLSVTNFINFAYGDYLTLAAYLAWSFTRAGIPLWLAIVFSGVLTGAIAVIIHILVFRRFMRRSVRPVTLLIAGLGVSFIVQDAMVIIWGTEPQRFTTTLGSARQVGPFLLTPGDMIIILTGAILLLGLHMLLAYTKFGKALRATSNNLDLAQASGINVERVTSITWFLVGVLTVVPAVALVLEQGTLDPTTGFNELFVIFGAVILGGVGRPYGAMLGALVVGVSTEVAGMYLNAGYKSSIAFALVIILLMFRPSGLLSAAGKTS